MQTIAGKGVASCFDNTGKKKTYQSATLSYTHRVVDFLDEAYIAQYSAAMFRSDAQSRQIAADVAATIKTARDEAAKGDANAVALCQQQWTRSGLDHCDLKSFLENTCRYSLPCAYSVALQLQEKQYTQDGLARQFVSYACAKAMFAAYSYMYSAGYWACACTAAPAPAPTQKPKVMVKTTAIKSAATKLGPAAEEDDVEVDDSEDVDVRDSEEGKPPACNTVAADCVACPSATCAANANVAYKC